MTDLLNDLDNATPEQIAEIAAILGMDATPTAEEPKAVPSAKIRCKVCGFHKKPRTETATPCRSGAPTRPGGR